MITALNNRADHAPIAREEAAALYRGVLDVLYRDGVWVTGAWSDRIWPEIYSGDHRDPQAVARAVRQTMHGLGYQDRQLVGRQRRRRAA